MAARRSPVLLGRAAERQALDRILENVRGGQSAVLVVRGEAGVGKTALLRYCARQASGFRVARIDGVESEMELPFAGLHQLCAPMLGKLDALPAPQQAALGTRWACPREPRRTASWSPWPRSACWPRAPPSGRCCASSTTPSGSTPPRRRSSGSSRDGCSPSRWRSCSPSANRARSASWWACPSWRSRGSPTRTPGPCSGPSSRAGSRSACVTGSSPRRVASRSRSWSCRGGWPRRKCRADSGSRRPTRCRGGSRRASCGDSTRSRTRRGCCCWSPRQSRSATLCSCGARPSDSASGPRRRLPTRRKACWPSASA